MNEEELKRLWREQKLDAPAKLSPGDQVGLMRVKMKCLDRVLQWNDAASIGGAILGIPVVIWIWYFLNVPPLARLGIVIAMVGEAFSLWKEFSSRRMLPQPPSDAPVTQWLRRELEKVRTECDLARSAFWWNVLPAWVGMNLFFWGIDIELAAQIGGSALITAIAVIYWKLNQHTLRKHWPPLREELEALLKSNTAD